MAFLIIFSLNWWRFLNSLISLLVFPNVFLCGILKMQRNFEEIMLSIAFAILLVLGIGHVNSFCFHAGGGIGEYHSDCSDSIGGGRYKS